MVDRQSRDRAAVLLRRFAASRITNDDFANSYPTSRNDLALRVVYDRSWFLYSDLCPEYLHASRDLRRELARWVLFLRSDSEYTWPRFRFLVPQLPAILNWLSRGWLQAQLNRPFERFSACGDFTVWPFRTQAEYEAALARRPFLAGRA